MRHNNNTLSSSFISSLCSAGADKRTGSSNSFEAGDDFVTKDIGEHRSESNSGEHAIAKKTASRKDHKRRKTKLQTAAATQLPGEAAVKKCQKLGDKITSLQQLVSPFGKTDTASVLHEAIIYIKALHEQIRVLSSPYFGATSSSPWQGGVKKIDLQSKGLCLVPVESTANLTGDLSNQSATGNTKTTATKDIHRF